VWQNPFDFPRPFSAFDGAMTPLRLDLDGKLIAQSLGFSDAINRN
jgi:hypothetical protein